MKNHHFYLFVLITFFTHLQLAGNSQKSETELWKRFEVSFENHSWQGNPFDIILTGIFTSHSGRRINHFGFYAGKDTWKIYFMPDEVGKWTFTTVCLDKDLDGKSGEFVCVNSNLDSPLIPAGNRWKLAKNGGDFPVIWNPPVRDGAHWGFRGRDLSDPMIRETLQFARKIVGARLLGFGELVIAPIDWAKEWPQSAVPYIGGKEGEEFYLPFWDQLNIKLDAARDLNMGAYIMLYGDDAMTPDHFGLTPRSNKELRLFRYVIARLSCYPHLLWDSGIDIGEYRDNDWIDWYAEWFNKHDPWRHPVGSRTGGGSGGTMPKKGTYFSTGGASLPGYSELLEFYKKNVPVAHTDHWRPFIERGDWTNHKIRIAMWRCGLTGAQAVYPDYNQGIINNNQVREGGQYIGFVVSFLMNEIHSDLADLQPYTNILLEGTNAVMTVNPDWEYIIYDEDGGRLTIDLTATHGHFQVNWYNPRNGETILANIIEGGRVHNFNSPTEGQDWTLHIFKN